MPKLTKSVVEAAVPREKQFTLWCSELSGFGVYILPTGKRTYFVDYRNAAGARKRMTIGRHGKITTEEARKLAISTLGGTVRGEDPATERATRRSSITVAELCDNYLKAAESGLIAGKRGAPKKASTLYVDRGRIARHIKPLLGKKLVKDVVRADVVKFMRDVATGKTAAVEKTKHRGKAVVEGGLGTSARTVGLLGSIMTFALGEGIIEQNPVAGVKKPADKKRERRLTAEEYRQLGKALEDAEADAEVGQAVTGTWLLALTGSRLGEIVELKLSEIDVAGGCFRLEDTKEGASVRPIGRPAFDVLAKAEGREGCPYVLPAVRGGNGPYGSLAAGLDRILKKAKLEGVTAHTLRHSFASVAGDLGFTESTIGAMLGHASGSVTSRYIHHLDTVLVAAADKVARAIHGQMTETEAKVIQMPKRGRSKS